MRLIYLALLTTFCIVPSFGQQDRIVNDELTITLTEKNALDKVKKSRIFNHPILNSFEMFVEYQIFFTIAV